MKKNLIFILLILFSLFSFSQTNKKIFTNDLNPAVNLDGANGNCTLFGIGSPNVFNISVSGVGTMSSVNQLFLVSIALSDCGTGTKNLDRVQIRLVSPSGQCVGIYSGGLSTIASGTHYLNLVSATNCLNNPNTSNQPEQGSTFLSSGINGYFNAQFNGVNANYSTFTGSADGTWRLVFSENTVNPPCLELIRLFFGDPNVINQSTLGDNCSNAIVWDGNSPICGTTTGLSTSSQIPGLNGITAVRIGGQICEWNATRDADVWIKYVATTNSTCLSISGISGANINAQSIVVTDANVDNDNNPCTQVPKTSTNDPNWILTSCPRNSVYSAPTGSKTNQQHCFTSEIGKTYYLVIDSDGSSIPKYWMFGFAYNGILNLTDNTNYIFIRNIDNKTNVKLVGNNIITNVGDNIYNQKIILYNSSGKIIYLNENKVIKQSIIKLPDFLNSGIFILNVIVYDKKNNNFVFKLIK